MRTKTLLLTAAVLAAGLGASVAQLVYSVNSVGYVNVTLRTGYNLVANPLNGANNNVNTTITGGANLADCTIARWDTGVQNFLPSDTYFFVGPADPANGWYDGSLNPSTTVINPGEGFFILNPNPVTTITFVGDVPQGTLTVPIAANFGFYAGKVPQTIDILSVGFPGQADMTYSTWDSVGQGYTAAATYFFIAPSDPGNGFYDQGLNLYTAAPAPGQGFLISNPGIAASWTRTFSVN